MNLLNTARLPKRFHFAGLILVLVIVLAATLRGDEPEAPAPAVPSAAEVAALLEREPISLKTWPVWRTRLLDWIGDRRWSTQAAYSAAWAFVKEQSQPSGTLPPPLEEDAFAWYLLGRSYLDSKGEERSKLLPLSEQALRRSIELDPAFARAHRNLAVALMLQLERRETGTPRALDVEQELRRACELDPKVTQSEVRAQAAGMCNDFPLAQRYYREALTEHPEDEDLAVGLVGSILADPQYGGTRSPEVGSLAARHPQNGTLAVFHALALAIDRDHSRALQELQRARDLGADAESLVGASAVQFINAPPPLTLGQLLQYGLAGLVAFYAAVIGGMWLAGIVLGYWTRGTGALKLLADEPLAIVAGGKVRRTAGEPWLARLYAVALMAGLVLFYVALPFVALGLLIGTLAVFWLILHLQYIPIKLLLLIGLVGGGMVWAVLKSMIPRMNSDVHGLPKTADEYPRLFETLRTVATRVDTRPVDEVYIVPGPEIAVFQVGRGPWGVFGKKRRVLTLGLPALRSLTVVELESILAHEYAHFSHQDTLYSRFIRRVDVSIHTALSGMGAAGGKLNYVNPFFWFLVQYYRAYSVLSAGFSRSREFLADRMACSLYGANVFESALTKTSMDGRLFEASAYRRAAYVLNVYQRFAEYRESEQSAEQREQIRTELEQQDISRMASHPTYRERLAAVAGFPPGQDTDPRPAMELFDDPQTLEIDLSNYLKGLLRAAQTQDY